MTIKHWTIYRILIMTVSGVFLFGCMASTPTAISTPAFTPLPEQMDKSPFTGVPCAAPCWQGLEVGKSSESEVTSVLSTLTFINQDSIQIFRRSSMPDYYVKDFGPGIEIDANCINPRTECLVLTTANDVLQKIKVRLNYEISADEAIRYLGAPDYMGYNDFSSERIVCEVYLAWSKGRLVLVTTFEDLAGAQKYCYVAGREGKVPANMPILEARYLSDVEFKAYLFVSKP